MSKTLLRIVCLVLAMLMVFGMVGCGSKNTATTSGDIEIDENDFSTQDEETVDGEDTGDTKTDSGAQTKTEKAGQVDETATDSKDKVKATTVANADSLSWSELVKQMPSNLRGTTIKVASWNPAKEVTGAESVIAKFTKQTGIKVEWVQIPYADYDAKVTALINAKDAPDLIRYRGPSIYRMALCQDLKSATGYDFSGAIWDEKVASKYTIKGKVYGINRKNTLINQPTVMMYRKSVIERYKMEDPYTLWKNGKWNWSKFDSMCKEYKKYNSGGCAWMPYNHLDMLGFCGDTLIKFDGSKFTVNVTSKSVYNELKEMCYYRADEITKSAMRQESYFEQGNVLFMTFNSIALRKTNAHFLSLKGDDDLYAVPIPQPSCSKTAVQPFSELEAYGIPKGAKNAAAAYYFLRFYLDGDNYDQSTYFCNSQALDVYKSCMAAAQKGGEYFYDSDEDLMEAVEADGGNLGGMPDWLRQGGEAAQLKSKLDEVAPTFKLAVQKANETLKKFK